MSLGDFSKNPRGLIILDRDGVLNDMVNDPDHGTIDSPLHPSQVKMLPGVPEALLSLNNLGYLLAIATNQPAAAKGKTTLENLQAVHEVVLSKATSKGAIILTSRICFHRHEDGCTCRKPKPGMLLEVLEIAGIHLRPNSWMVGDGSTDIEAGKAAGVKTAFLGLSHCYSCKFMQSFPPDLRCKSLVSFVESLQSPAV